MTLSLKQIHDRCEEVGECLLWKQSCTPSGYPRVNGGYAHILAWEASHDMKVPKGLNVRRKCLENRCCNVDHMVLMTRAKQNEIAAARGSWSKPARIAAITVAMRARSKFTPEDIHAIRMSDEPGTVLAARYEVSRTLISRIRLRKSWADGARNSSVFNQAA